MRPSYVSCVTPDGRLRRHDVFPRVSPCAAKCISVRSRDLSNAANLVMDVCTHHIFDCATEPREGGGRAKKSIFLKYLNLNSNFSILDNFPNDGSIFPAASEKNQSKSSRQKKVSGGRGICTPRSSFSS